MAEGRAMEESETMNEICLVHFPPPLLRLKTTIEDAARCTIRYYASASITIEAGSSFNDEGLFIVFKNIFRDITLCHELLHLELLKDGYPVFEKVSPEYRFFPFVVDEAINTICSIIQHKIIYPKMILLGYDPYTSLVEKADTQFLQDMNDQTLPHMAQYIVDADMQLRIHYLRLLCEIPNADVTRHLGRQLTMLSPQGLQLARETADVINNARVESPAAALATTRQAFAAFGFAADLASPRYYRPTN